MPLGRAGILRNARPHMSPRGVEAIGHVVAARYHAVDVIAAAAASTPAQPIAAGAPKAEKVAIGTHGQHLGGVVAIAVFLRFGIGLAAFVHGGFLSCLILPSNGGGQTMSETLAAPSPRVRGEGGVRGRHRCLSVAGDR
jgi:hypothetical protein